MMIEKVMIQLGVHFDLCPKSKKWQGGFGGGSPRGDQKVMIQLGAKKYKKQRGGVLPP